jgi:hypothetical protein
MFNDLITVNSAPFLAINQRSDTFWKDNQKHMSELMEDEDVLKGACELVMLERERQVPGKNSLNFNRALEQSKKTVERLRRGQARKGGLASKTDSLQKIIMKFVLENPNMTQRKLLSSLKKQEFLELSFDNKSNVLAGDGVMIRWSSEDGRKDCAPVSGLKDRLSRAKKRMSSDVSSRNGVPVAQSPNMRVSINWI